MTSEIVLTENGIRVTFGSARMTIEDTLRQPTYEGDEIRNNCINISLNDLKVLEKIFECYHEMTKLKPVINKN
jgi:hypothetical protein